MKDLDQRDCNGREEEGRGEERERGERKEERKVIDYLMYTQLTLTVESSQTVHSSSLSDPTV